MSRFDPTRNQRSPEEWSAIAFKKTTDNNVQWTIAGGMVLGAIVASAASPITGLLVVGWAIYDAVQKTQEIQRNQMAIRDHGCVAHVLDGDDFRSFARQVGRETVMKELEFAAQEGYTFSDAALDYLEEESPQILEPSYQTSVGAIAPSQQVTQIQQVQTNSSSYNSSPVIDIVDKMTNPIRNCIIFGIGGSGKGMLVANSLRAIKQKYPDCKIFYIDPKDEPGEYGYTDGIVDVVRRFKCKGQPSAVICKWLNEVLDEYQNEWLPNQSRSLLVIDEGTTLGDAAKKEKDTRVGTLILHTASLGGSSREKVWLMAQSPYVGPMGLDLTQTSQVTSIALIDKTNLNVLKQWKKSSILEQVDIDVIRQLIKSSPCERAVFFGGDSEWYSMPSLANYSDIDRDKEIFGGLQKQTAVTCQDALNKDERESLRQAEIKRMVAKIENTIWQNIDEFITYDLESPSRINELKPAIIKALEQSKRTDLLEKFGIQNP